MTTADGNKLYAKSGDLESYIEQTDGTLKSVVKKGDVISSINQSEEEVSIDAKHINLNGVVTANEYFRIMEDGSVATKNLTIGGAVFQPFVAAEDSDAEPTPITDIECNSYDSDADYIKIAAQMYKDSDGIVTAYKVKSQFQLDVSLNVVVLPTDDKYIGCHVTLLNSHFAVTRMENLWATPVIVENGYFAYGTNLEYNELEFRGGTIELMFIKTKENTLWHGGQKAWMVVNKNCDELTYHKQVEV
jgi:hypothetical protein